MTDEITQVFEVYGADLQVLDEYNVAPLRARIVRDTIKIRTTIGTRGLKKVFLSDDRLRYIHAGLEYAFSQGVPIVPRFIHNRYGDPYVLHSSGTYYMTGWLAGREADFRKLPELLAGVRLLSNWHHAMVGYRPSQTRIPLVRTTRERIQTAANDFAEAKRIAETATTQTPFQRLLIASASDLQDRCNQAFEQFRVVGIEEAERAARSNGQICHGNYHRQNVLFDGTSWAVLNYDGIHPGLPMTDLASLCHRYLPAFEWDEAVVKDLWDAYQTNTDVSAQSLLQLNALLSVPLRSLQVVSWYHRGVKEWDEDDYVDYFEACLQGEETREHGRRVLQSMGEKESRSPSIHFFASDGDWTTASFALQEKKEGHPIDTLTIEDSTQSLAASENDREAPTHASSKVGSDAPRQSTRKRRPQRREQKPFRPKEAGLSLWSPNEHRRKDNKQEEQHD